MRTCLCFFFKQKTAYELPISDGSSVVFSSDLLVLYPEAFQGASIMANSDNAKPPIAELLLSMSDTYHWPDTMPSAVIKRIPNTRSVVARFQGTYSFTDISGIAPFKIIPAGDGSFTFDRGDGHREPLYASGEGLVGKIGRAHV